MLNAKPSINSDDDTKFIEYYQDTTSYFQLDPTHTQLSNIFFVQSLIRLK